MGAFLEYGGTALFVICRKGIRDGGLVIEVIIMPFDFEIQIRRWFQLTVSTK